MLIDTNILHSFAHASLRVKLLSAMLGVCVITALSLGTAFVLEDLLRQRDATFSSLKLVGKIVGEQALDAYHTGDANINHKMKLLEYNPSITSACLYNFKGSLVGTYYAVDIFHKCPQTAPSKDTLTLEEIVLYQSLTLPGSSIKGGIYIVSSAFLLKESVIQSITVMSLIVVVVLLFVYLFVHYVLSYLSRPLTDLIHTTAYVTEHNDYQCRARKYYDDDIGMLTDSFNHMMNQIEKASHTLEDKISKRTHALRAEKQKAETANEAKTEFLRNMSHEFRTPLHAMNSFSIYGLNEAHEADREKLHRYFSRIHRGTKRLLALVDEILTMARLESGKEHFNFTPHDIKLLLESVIEDAQSLCNDKHIDITLTLENSENSSFSTQLVCDGPRIVQVLTNILGNAIRFSPEKGSIIWEMTLTDINNTPHLQMACHDEGVGIPEDELHSIFDKFVQSSRTNTGAGGTGLGLAIARHIIISHQGTITASNSSSLKGACFTLTLPCDLQRQTKEVHSIVS